MSNERTRIDWEMARQQLHEADLALERALTADPEKIDRIYRERAGQLATRHTQAKATARTVSVLVFALGSETYGIPIADLTEVLLSTQCTPVPGAAREIAGVINLRGEIRSVIDLRLLLALPGADDDSAGRILMIRNGAEEVGLKVGPVQGVQLIRPDALASPEGRLGEASGSFFAGFTPEKVIVLSTAAVLSHAVFRPKSR